MEPEDRSGDYPLETTTMPVHNVMVECNVIKCNLSEQVLTDGHPLHWDLTFSAIIPTAANLALIDLTTPVTSFPAASCGPASVPTSVSVCLCRKS